MKLLHSPRQQSFENMFPQTAERGGGNYDLHYQNSVRKYGDDLEHFVFFILIGNFFKCDGFTVLYDDDMQVDLTMQ